MNSIEFTDQNDVQLKSKDKNVIFKGFSSALACIINYKFLKYFYSLTAFFLPVVKTSSLRI